MTLSRPTNNLVTPLLTDLYQITMGYAYWKTNTHMQPASFELFFRKNPFKGSFTIFCGIDGLPLRKTYQRAVAKELPMIIDCR